MENSKISIILPVYNAEEYIEEALDSILSQTIGLEKLEVIMVNDASTDLSGEIVDKYASLYNNFKAVHLNECSGAAGKPRNVGIEQATSDYIMFLDPDDFYTHDACEILYEEIIRMDSDIAFGSFNVLHADKSINKHNSFSGFSKDFYVEKLEEKESIISIVPSVWAKIYRKSFINDNKILFPEKIAAQDLVFVVSGFIHAKGIAYINRPVCNYRVRDQNNKSITFNINARYLSSINTAYSLVFRELQEFRKEKYFIYLLEAFVPYYVNGIIDSKQLDDEEILNALKNMQWIFRKCKEVGKSGESELIDLIYDSICNDEFELAMKFIKAVKPTRQWSLELNEAKEYISKQLENYKDENNKLKAALAELRDWCKQLEEGKLYIEAHCNQEKEVLNKIIEEQKTTIENMKLRERDEL